MTPEYGLILEHNNEARIYEGKGLFQYVIALHPVYSTSLKGQEAFRKWPALSRSLTKCRISEDYHPLQIWLENADLTDHSQVFSRPDREEMEK